MALKSGPNLNALVYGLAGEGHYLELLRQWRTIDALVQPSVIDRVAAVPTSGMVDGDRFLLTGGPNSGQIARYSVDKSPVGWEYFSPRVGWVVWVNAEQQAYRFKGSPVATWQVETGGGEVNTASNLGSGYALFAAKVGVDFQFKTITAGPNVSISDTANEITISAAAGGGEANTASNLGTGYGLYSNKSGVDLQFKSLVAGANVSISQTATEITISATGGGGGSGTVTSVGLSVPTGLSVAGSPVTTAGTLAISFSSGYSIPTTAKQGQWDMAYGWGNHATAGYIVSTPSLAAFAALTGAADRMPYFTSASAMAVTPIFAFGRTLVGAANAGAALTTLGIADIPSRVQTLENSPAAKPWLAVPWTGAADYDSVTEGLWIITSAMANTPAGIGNDALVRVERADGNRLIQTLFSLTSNVSFWRMRIFFGGNYIWVGWQKGLIADDWTNMTSFLNGFTALAGYPNRIRLFGTYLHVQFSLNTTSATKTAGTAIWSIPTFYRPPYQVAIPSPVDLSGSVGAWGATTNVVISDNTIRLGAALNGTAQKLIISALLPLEAP